MTDPNPRGVVAIGAPGRAAMEIGAGIPPTEPWPSDISASEYEVGPLTIRAGSVRGVLHRDLRNNEPRQDAYGLAFDPEAGVLVAVVCDGVGSLPHSHEAAAHVCRELPWRYLESHDWGQAFRQVNDSLEVLARSRPEWAEAGKTTMATTVMAAVIQLQETNYSVELAWVGDSEAWSLVEEEAWVRLAPAKPDQHEDSVATGKTTALPTTVEPAVRTTKPMSPPRRLFLMTDGVGTPLKMNTEVQQSLAAWWNSPPDPYTFVRQVGFARSTFTDDKTVLGIWIDPPRSSPDTPGASSRDNKISDPEPESEADQPGSTAESRAAQ